MRRQITDDALQVWEACEGRIKIITLAEMIVDEPPRLCFFWNALSKTSLAKVIYIFNYR